MKLDLVRPTLILDESKCRANIAFMVEKAKRHGVGLRPHFKTHQSHEVGRWFREAGVTRCTVSSVAMAEYFAADGWNDITVAFPLNQHEADSIDKLASEIQLNLLAVNAEALQNLDARITHRVGVFVEVDTGYHRTGLDPDDEAGMASIFAVIDGSRHFDFKGFLSHAGHSYKCRGKRQVEEVHRVDVALHNNLKSKHRARYPALISSIGDTPSMSCSDYFNGMDEIRPGNFVFYDLTQVAIGACSKTQVAVGLACPVVAKYPERNEVILHGGAVHFSKDSLMNADGTTSFGEVFAMDDEWGVQPKGYLKSISQEHGIVRCTGDSLGKISIGDFLIVLPVHSCLAADVMKSYTTMEGVRIEMMRW